MLSFFFCDASDHLHAELASSDVFDVVVASPAVASFLLRAGHKHVHTLTTNLYIHRNTI
jgi:hypothetical protein